MTARFLAVAFFLFLPTLALASSDYPVLASGSGTGGMWYAVKIPTGTTCLWLNSTHEYASSGFGMDMYIQYDENYSVLSRHLVTGWSDELEITIGSSAVGKFRVQPLPYNETDWNSWDVRIGCEGGPPTTAESTVVVIRSGWHVGDWTFTASSPDPIALDATWGSKVQLYQARYFEGVATLHVGAYLPTLRANLLTDREIDIEQHLLGGFVTSRIPPSVSLMQATTPTGELDCPCVFDQYVGPSARGAGEYEFRLTEFGGPESDTGLLTADVILPS